MSASTSVPRSVSPREQLAHPRQLDLFGDEQPSAVVAAPAWQELPAQTQAELTSLMTRLILGSRTGSATEAGHDL
jgi:hypothetical protein